MNDYLARIERLEALPTNNVRRSPERRFRPEELEAFGVRLQQKMAEWAAERERRRSLSLEEQIALLKADREQRRKEKAQRVLRGDGAGPVTLDALDVCEERINEIQIAELERKLADGGAMCEPGAS